LALKLKPPAYLTLGLLRLGASSGYAIKKAADVSTRFFWPTSLAQVYPELARLEREGFVTRRDDPRGARARSAYEITERGEAALLTWLRSTHEAPLQFRDEGVLRLFFADALPSEDQLALLRRLRERAHTANVQMRSEIARWLRYSRRKVRATRPLWPGSAPTPMRMPRDGSPGWKPS
jgi:DNA-binding PadR family transcriptional regulator